MESRFGDTVREERFKETRARGRAGRTGARNPTRRFEASSRWRRDGAVGRMGERKRWEGGGPVVVGEDEMKEEILRRRVDVRPPEEEKVGRETASGRSGEERETGEEGEWREGR
ncbi:hypothetical protein GCM10023238_10620 [Streptomyces heliomycini]